MPNELQLIEKSRTISDRALVRPDRNILRWSILFAPRQYKGNYREIWRTTKNGQVGVIIGKLRNRKGEEIAIGFLIVADLKTFLALVHIWENAGKPTDEPVFCTLTDLLRLMRKSDGQKNFENLQRSLERLHTIPVKWIGTFRFITEEGDEVVLSETESVPFLQRLRFTKARVNGKRLCTGITFKFHDLILNNLVHGYTRPANFRVIAELENDLSVLTYCHLDTVLADKPQYAVTSKRLFEQIGTTKYKYPSKRLEKLKPVIAELEGKPLSTGILVSIKVMKTSDGKDWKMVFRKLPFRALGKHRENQDALQDHVESALQLVGEAGNDITRKFLFKAGHRLGPEAIYQTVRVLKADYIDNPTATVKTSLGAILVDELQRLAESRGVSLD